jgi:16S rRNA (guanine527-N7)-methyltransferase
MEILKKYFSDFTPQQTSQFEALKGLYEEWNEKINVISRKDMENFYTHHVLHSLAIAAKFNVEKHARVMDLGTGGGFPGLPLAIFFPECEFHLVDSINKKLQVVKEVAAVIGLTNVTVQHTRVKDIKNRQFDVVVSRAVAPLKDLWFWSKPLIQKTKILKEGAANGLICLKGGDLSKEIFESGCKPFVWEVDKIFNEPHFKEKYLIYQPFKK